MFTISDSIHIKAPIERCFLLSTNIDLVAETLGMKPIEGKETGMIVGGDRLLWAGWKFCMPQMHESIISAYEYPSFFQDTMGRGRFKRFQHDHQLHYIDDHTILNDKIRFSMPFGFMGRFAAHTLVLPHISNLLRRRMHLLKTIAETDEWRHYLPDHPENL